MQQNAKTLLEMTQRERTEMIAAVAHALEATAGEAQQVGDQRFAANSFSLAQTIRGCSSSVATRDIHATEILLQQGIALVASFSAEPTREATVH